MASRSKAKKRLPDGCQVPGCTVDLGELRIYYQRHHICMHHLMLPTFTFNGKLQRFCQQCAKFEELSAFDGPRRTCRYRLDAHNRRRRKHARGSPVAPDRRCSREAAGSPDSTLLNINVNVDNSQTDSPEARYAEFKRVPSTNEQANQEHAPLGLGELHCSSSISLGMPLTEAVDEACVLQLAQEWSSLEHAHQQHNTDQPHTMQDNTGAAVCAQPPAAIRTHFRVPDLQQSVDPLSLSSHAYAHHPVLPTADSDTLSGEHELRHWLQKDHPSEWMTQHASQYPTQQLRSQQPSHAHLPEANPRSDYLSPDLALPYGSLSSPPIMASRHQDCHQNLASTQGSRRGGDGLVVRTTPSRQHNAGYYMPADAPSSAFGGASVPYAWHTDSNSCHSTMSLYRSPSDTMSSMTNPCATHATRNCASILPHSSSVCMEAELAISEFLSKQSASVQCTSAWADYRHDLLHARPPYGLPDASFSTAGTNCKQLLHNLNNMEQDYAHRPRDDSARYSYTGRHPDSRQLLSPRQHSQSYSTTPRAWHSSCTSQQPTLSTASSTSHHCGAQRSGSSDRVATTFAGLQLAHSGNVPVMAAYNSGAKRACSVPSGYTNNAGSRSFVLQACEEAKQMFDDWLGAQGEHYAEAGDVPRNWHTLAQSGNGAEMQHMMDQLAEHAPHSHALSAVWSPSRRLTL